MINLNRATNGFPSPSESRNQRKKFRGKKSHETVSTPTNQEADLLIKYQEFQISTPRTTESKFAVNLKKKRKTKQIWQSNERRNRYEAK